MSRENFSAKENIIKPNTTTTQPANEEYKQFDENSKIVGNQLKAMQVEDAKVNEPKSRTVLDYDVISAYEAIREMQIYYDSLQKGTTFAATIEQRLSSAENQYKEIRKIAKDNGMKFAKAPRPKERKNSNISQSSYAKSTATSSASSIPEISKTDENKEKSLNWAELEKNPFEDDAPVSHRDKVLGEISTTIKTAFTPKDASMSAVELKNLAETEKGIKRLKEINAMPKLNQKVVAEADEINSKIHRIADIASSNINNHQGKTDAEYEKIITADRNASRAAAASTDLSTAVAVKWKLQEEEQIKVWDEKNPNSDLKRIKDQIAEIDTRLSTGQAELAAADKDTLLTFVRMTLPNTKSDLDKKAKEEIRDALKSTTLQLLDNINFAKPNEITTLSNSLTFFTALAKIDPTSVNYNMLNQVTQKNAELPSVQQAVASTTPEPIADLETKKPPKIDLGTEVESNLIDIFERSPSSQIAETKIAESKSAGAVAASNKALQKMTFSQFFADREKHPDDWNRFEAKIKANLAHENTDFLKAHAEFLKNPTKENYADLYEKYIKQESDNEINIPAATTRIPLDEIMNKIKNEGSYNVDEAKNALNNASKHVEGTLDKNFFPIFKLESLETLESAFKNISQERPLSRKAIKDIAELKTEYLRTVVNAVQNHKPFDLEAAKNSPLVNFHNTNLPIISKYSGTRKAINYAENHKKDIETSLENKESQTILLTAAPDKHISKIINNSLIQKEKQENPAMIKKIGSKSLQENFDSIVNDMKKFFSRGSTTPKETEDITTSDLIQTSKSFFEAAQKNANHKLPETRANSIENLIKSGETTKEQVAEDAKNTHPIAHTEVHSLIQNFLDHKRANGSDIEKAIYKDMTPEIYLQERAINKRPLMFMGSEDNYILRNGIKSRGGWENVGTNQESSIKLQDYNSYDEIQINALIGISTPTDFINNGNRDNFAKKGNEGTYEKKGILGGLVGCRFEKPGLMDYQHMVITKEQNTAANGYGLEGDPKKSQNMAHFAKLYGQPYFPNFEEAEGEYNANRDGKYLKIIRQDGEPMYFNKEVYKERMRLVTEPFLNDVNAKAKSEGKDAYIHAVGLGLGAWSKIDGIPCADELGKLQVEVYAELLQSNKYQNISNVNFSWFPDEAQGNLNNTKIGNIDIVFSKRNPADPLTGNDTGKLLVAQYAWDGNSATHNEYWGGQLNNSGDPAAGCCSTSPELSNPDINKHLKTAEYKLSGEDRSEQKAQMAKSPVKLEVGAEAEYQQWEKKYNAEFNQAVADYEKLSSTAAPPRPTQGLPPLTPKEQETIRALEMKIENAIHSLHTAEIKIAHSDTMRQALGGIHNASAEIHELRSKTNNVQMQEKLSDLDKKIHTAVETADNHSKLHPVETKVEEAISALNFAVDHPKLKSLMPQALAKIDSARSDISVLKEKNASMEGKLSDLEKKLTSATDKAGVKPPETPKANAVPEPKPSPQAAQAKSEEKHITQHH